MIQMVSFTKHYKFLLILIFSFFLSTNLISQNLITVSFNNGFVGTIGQNSGKADNIKTFSTLGINRVFFIQNSTTNIFQLQGNDISGLIRLQLNSGQLIDIPGAIVWRITSGSTLECFGFIPASTIQPINLTYGSSQTYTINSTSNFGLRLIASSYSLVDNTSVSGNAATNGLLSALNEFLVTSNSLNPNGPVTVLPQTTSDTTPIITGSVTLATGENLTIVVNNVLYNTSNGVVINGGNWSLPIINALPIATYDVTTYITNSSGYILNDSTSGELVITTVPTQNIWYVDNNSNAGDIYTTSSVSGNDTTGTGSASAPFATLSKAITSASAGDIIYVDSGTYSQNSIIINKKLTIIGAGSGNTIFDNGDGGQLWANITSSNVIIKNLTLTKFFNANGSFGQVININGSYSGINIENVVINNCLGATSTLPNVNVSGGANVTIKNSLFKCSGYNGAMGGGLLVNNSTAVIENTIFFQNESASSTENGGAIQIKGASANVTVTNCTFNGCVSLKGGAIGQNAGTLTITGSCFSNNISETDDNSSGGGAIFVNGTSNTSISNCLFDTNAVTAQAKGTTSISVGNATSADGGAICFKNVNGTSSVTNCRFENNGKLLQTDGQLLINGFDDGQDIFYSGSSLNITISNNTFSSANSGEVNIYEDTTGNQTMSNNGIYTQTGSTGPTVNALSTTRTGVSDGTQTGWSDTSLTGTTTINMLGSLLTPIRTDVYSTCSTVVFTGWIDNSVTQGGTCNNAINQAGCLILSSALSSTISPAMDFSSSSAGKYLTFRARTNGGTNTAANEITVSVSTNNGTNWTTIGTSTPTTATLTQMTPFDLSTYTGNQVKVRFQSLSATGTIGVGIDDIVVTSVSTLITPSLDFSNKGVQVLYTSALVGGTSSTYNLIKTSISEDNGTTWTQINTSTTAGSYTLDLYNYHGTTTKLKFETPYANGTSGASLDNITFNYATSSNTNPDTNCKSTTSITGCNSTLNCSLEALAPIILNCVENKSIANCSLTLPDFRSEISAYDDCSFTISQSPAPGTLLSSLGNGNHTVTFIVSDLSTNSQDTSCSMVLTVSGCTVCTPPSTPSATVTEQPTCAIPTGTIVFTTQSDVEYSINGTNYQSSATFTGVTTGNYTLSVRSVTNNTCLTTGTTVTVNTVTNTSSIVVGDIVINENAGYAIFDVQGPNNSYVSLYLTNVTALGNGVDYGASSTQTTLGQTNLEYSIDNGATWLIYQNYVQIPGCDILKVRTPLNDDINIEPNETFNLIVKPISVNLGVIDLYDVNYNTINLSSLVLESGTAEAVNSVYKKTNAITVNSQAIDVKIKIIAKSNIGTNAADYVFDNDTTNNTRFQSEINSTSASGSFVDYKIEFFKSSSNVPVALINFYITGVDIDGNSATSKEYIELSNFSSYTVNNPTGLTIGVSPTNSQNTRFTGIDNSLNGITFENTASFIANYQSPLTELNFKKGVTGTNSSARQFSVAFGAAGGVFSSPVITATDDSEIAIATITDNDSCTVGTPTASVTVQPTCATTTGTIVFTTQTGVEYSINGTTYQSSASFTGIAAGSYTLKVRSTSDNTCKATGSSVTVNAVPSAPSTPTGSVTVQPTCATTTGTIVFTSQ